MSIESDVKIYWFQKFEIFYLCSLTCRKSSYIYRFFFHIHVYKSMAISIHKDRHEDYSQLFCFIVYTWYSWRGRRTRVNKRTGRELMSSTEEVTKVNYDKKSHPTKYYIIPFNGYEEYLRCFKTDLFDMNFMYC